MTALVALTFAATLRHSLIPRPWLGLSLGMPRAEVLKHISTRLVDERYIKGFDLVTTPVGYRFGARGYWMLVMTYDGSDHLKDGQAEFFCFDSEYSNILLPSPLLYRINKQSIWHIK